MRANMVVGWSRVALLFFWGTVFVFLQATATLAAETELDLDGLDMPAVDLIEDPVIEDPIIEDPVIAPAAIPIEDVPEEILRTEIITGARSPLTGEPLSAVEYAQLQAELAAPAGGNLVSEDLQYLIFLLQLRRAIKPIIPFIP